MEPQKKDKMLWEKPTLTVSLFDAQDVIRTSGGFTVDETGSGDRANWRDLFGNT